MESASTVSPEEVTDNTEKRTKNIKKGFRKAPTLDPVYEQEMVNCCEDCCMYCGITACIAACLDCCTNLDCCS